MAESGYSSCGSAQELINVSDFEDDTKHKLPRFKTEVKDFDTIISELIPKTSNVMKLKLKNKDDGKFTILPENVGQRQKMECKNHLQGCPKVDTPDTVRNHQLTCTFPPLKFTK